jgi:hypothetical protein
VTAGYSGTPLVRKLGIREGMKIAVLNAPRAYDDIVELPQGVRLAGPRATDLDFVHVFAAEAKHLDALGRLRDRISQSGMIWVSWPKKSSGVATNVTETIVRETGLAAGLVDVKICAVDDTWSGLKFVIRKADRR